MRAPVLPWRDCHGETAGVLERHIARRAAQGGRRATARIVNKEVFRMVLRRLWLIAASTVVIATGAPWMFGAGDGAAHAQQAAAAPAPQSAQATQHAAALFQQNCVACHGAPGTAPVVQGLTPPPPNLFLANRRNTPAETVTKVTNGIPGSAMPAFGGQLSAQDIQQIAVFLHDARGITPDRFAALLKTAQK
jgi:mono/diheme cytochrome c family protein